jgi:hypothetical protein
MKARHASIAVLGALALAAPAFAQSLDHLACYKVKDSARGRFTMVVTNAGVTQNCTAKLPARMACLESSASGVSPTPPGGGPSSTDAGNFLCYTVKCARPFPPAFAMADDLGGSRNVNLRKAQIVCTEASRGGAVAGPTPSPSSTTTTTLGGPCHFDDSSRTCEGSCGGGGHCAATAASGACECRTTACGDASRPQCNGFCSDPNEACVFTLTGCSCTTIP